VEPVELPACTCLTGAAPRSGCRAEIDGRGFPSCARDLAQGRGSAQAVVIATGFGPSTGVKPRHGVLERATRCAGTGDSRVCRAALWSTAGAAESDQSNSAKNGTTSGRGAS
jgi:hypothetical protein